MGAESTPAPAGLLSPDGRRKWDGTKWVPAPLGPLPRFAPFYRGPWWIAVGCIVLMFITVGAMVFAIKTVVDLAESGNSSCLPSDFPAYPGARLNISSTYIGTGLPTGDSKRCTVTLESADDVSTVTDWYSSHLNKGDWRSTPDAGNGTINFRRDSRPQTVGSVKSLGAGQRTEMVITLYS